MTPPRSDYYLSLASCDSIRFSSVMKRRCCKVGILIAGILTFCLGLTIFLGFDSFLNLLVNQNLPLQKGGVSYSPWLNPDTQADVYMQFWLFDLQNADDVVNNNANPIVVQRGPYTYRERRPKENVTFNTSDSVSYLQPKRMIFEKNMSAGNENDTITTVNIPAYTMATVINTLPISGAIAKTIRNQASRLLLASEKLFVQSTVYETLWNFNADLLRQRLKALEDNFIFKLLEKYKLVKHFSLPDPIALFENGANDGLYLVNTGMSHLERLGQIMQWQGSSRLPFWTTESCNAINGTDGSLWKPHLSKSDRLYMFSSDICRSIYGVFDSEITIKGIKCYRYIPPASVFANRTENPDNVGFCTPDVNHCLGSGAPVIVSQPHFLQGDQKYIDRVVGMDPDPGQHSTFLDLEPTLGVSVRLAKHLQINVGIKALPEFIPTMKISPLLIFPVLWLNESGLIKDEPANEVKLMLYTSKKIALGAQIAFGLIGALLLVFGIIWCMRDVKDKPSDERLISPINADSDSFSGVNNPSVD